MRITPIEIRQKEFEKVLRGYDKDEVKAYLQSLSQEWERVLDESKDLRVRLENSEKELAKLRELENSLFKTLKTAEDTGANLVQQARKETELHLKESRLQADEILADARQKAKNIIGTADQKARVILDDMVEKIKKLENNYNQVWDQREKLIGRFRNLISENSEKLEMLLKDLPDKESSGIVRQAKELIHATMVDNIEHPHEASKKPISLPDPEKVEDIEQSAPVETKKPGDKQKSFFDEL